MELVATVLNRAGLHSLQAAAILPWFLRITFLVFTLQLQNFPQSTLGSGASSHGHHPGQTDPQLWSQAQLTAFWCLFLLADWIRTLSDCIIELQMWGRSRALEIFPPRSPWCTHLPPSHQFWNTGRYSLGQTSEKTPLFFSGIICTILALIPWLRGLPSGILPRKEKICSKMT